MEKLIVLLITNLTTMKKLLTILLTLFLFSSAYDDERMSKDNLLKQWEGSVVSMTGLYDKPISFKVSNGELTYIKNSNSSATDAWIRDNGKLHGGTLVKKKQ